MYLPALIITAGLLTLIVLGLLFSVAKVLFSDWSDLDISERVLAIAAITIVPSALTINLVFFFSAIN